MDTRLQDGTHLTERENVGTLCRMRGDEEKSPHPPQYPSTGGDSGLNNRDRLVIDHWLNKRTEMPTSLLTPVETATLTSPAPLRSQGAPAGEMSRGYLRRRRGP